MEFLDINLTKKSESFNPCCTKSLLLADFFKETILFSGFKTPYKKSGKQEIKVYSDQHFVEQKMKVENQTKLESEKTRVYAQKPRLKMPFKDSISMLWSASLWPPCLCQP